MTPKPTTLEIQNLITRMADSRERWRGNAGYARCLDIELHALRLLLHVTHITEEEDGIAVALGIEGARADG